MSLLGVLVMCSGCLMIASAVSNWDVWMTAPRAQLVVALLGRRGARILYVLLGLLLVGLGVLLP